MSKALAARLASKTLTGTLAGRPITFPIGQTIDAAGEFVVLDIADAQQALHRYGKLDRIDVTVGPRKTSPAWRKPSAARCRFRHWSQSPARAAKRTSACCAPFAGTCAC